MSPCRCRCLSRTRWQTNLVRSADISYSHRAKTNQLGMLGKILHPWMSFGTVLLGMTHTRRPVQDPLLHRHTWCIWHCLAQTFRRHHESCMMLAPCCWCTRFGRKTCTFFGSFDRCTSQECKESRTVALHPSDSILPYNCRTYLDQQSPASNQLDNFGNALFQLSNVVLLRRVNNNLTLFCHP